MMQKLWQKKPKLSYNEQVFDIVQFGSSVKEGAKPNDIDIAVIFKQGSEKEQLEGAQKIKRQLEKISELPIHIKPFDLYSFFDIGNFAKENVLFYGMSLIYGDYFAKRFGLIPKTYLFYSLNDMDKKDKVRFNYALSGRVGSYGLIRKYGGRILRPGLVEVFPEYEDLFFDSLKKITNKIVLQKKFDLA